jgi:hypothetical protein
MATVIEVVLGVLGITGLFLVLRNFRRQRDDEPGPGIVPEDYE